MGAAVEMAVGTTGNAASLLLYVTPMVTFRRVLRKKTTEEFSCMPYIVALLNCLLYTWYGLPVVSKGWENFPLVTTNGVGVVMEISFIAIYIWYAPKNRKKQNIAVLMSVLAVFSAATTVSSFSLHDQRHKKALIGTMGIVAAMSMYSSPLIAMKQVIKTKSVEYMPFSLSFFSFLASLLWMSYGLLKHDLFIAAPNLVGCPMGFLQLILYSVYKQYQKTAMVAKGKGDLESNNVEIAKNKGELESRSRTKGDLEDNHDQEMTKTKWDVESNHEGNYQAQVG